MFFTVHVYTNNVELVVFNFAMIHMQSSGEVGHALSVAKNNFNQPLFPGYYQYYYSDIQSEGIVMQLLISTQVGDGHAYVLAECMVYMFGQNKYVISLKTTPPLKLMWSTF